VEATLLEQEALLERVEVRRRQVLQGLLRHPTAADTAEAAEALLSQRRLRALSAAQEARVEAVEAVAVSA
jgi:hypothetical protein